MIMDCVCTNTVIAQPTSVKFSAGTVTALATRPTQMPALHSLAARAARAPCLYCLCRRHHCCRCASAHLRSSGRGRHARAMRARHFVPPLPALSGSRRCAASVLRGLGRELGVASPHLASPSPALGARGCAACCAARSQVCGGIGISLCYLVRIIGACSSEKFIQPLPGVTFSA